MNGGYGWSAANSNLNGIAERPCEDENCITIPDPAGSFNGNGGFGGGQIGYNLQRDRLVFGVEADIQGAAIDGSGAVGLLGGTHALAAGRNDLDMFGTVRARLGYAVDSTLIYFTGGFAFGDVKETLSLTPVAGPTSVVSREGMDTGYALGGGVEQMFSPRWSAKLEYQYIDLGSDKLFTTACCGLAAATLNAAQTYHTIRLGLNYHLDGGYEPLK